MADAKETKAEEKKRDLKLWFDNYAFVKYQLWRKTAMDNVLFRHTQEESYAVIMEEKIKLINSADPFDDFIQHCEEFLYCCIQRNPVEERIGSFYLFSETAAPVYDSIISYYENHRDRYLTDPFPALYALMNLLEIATDENLHRLHLHNNEQKVFAIANKLLADLDRSIPENREPFWLLQTRCCLSMFRVMFTYFQVKKHAYFGDAYFFSSIAPVLKQQIELSNQIDDTQDFSLRKRDSVYCDDFFCCTAPENRRWSIFLLRAYLRKLADFKHDFFPARGEAEEQWLKQYGQLFGELSEYFAQIYPSVAQYRIEFVHLVPDSLFDKRALEENEIFCELLMRIPLNQLLNADFTTIALIMERFFNFMQDVSYDELRNKTSDFFRYLETACVSDNQAARQFVQRMLPKFCKPSGSALILNSVHLHLMVGLMQGGEASSRKAMVWTLLLGATGIVAVDRYSSQQLFDEAYMLSLRATVFAEIVELVCKENWRSAEALRRKVVLFLIQSAQAMNTTTIGDLRSFHDKMSMAHRLHPETYAKLFRGNDASLHHYVIFAPPDSKEFHEDRLHLSANPNLDSLTIGVPLDLPNTVSLFKNIVDTQINTIVFLDLSKVPQRDFNNLHEYLRRLIEASTSLLQIRILGPNSEEESKRLNLASFNEELARRRAIFEWQARRQEIMGATDLLPELATIVSLYDEASTGTDKKDHEAESKKDSQDAKESKAHKDSKGHETDEHKLTQQQAINSLIPSGSRSLDPEFKIPGINLWGLVGEIFRTYVAGRQGSSFFSSLANLARDDDLRLGKIDVITTALHEMEKIANPNISITLNLLEHVLRQLIKLRSIEQNPPGAIEQSIGKMLSQVLQKLQKEAKSNEATETFIARAKGLIALAEYLPGQVLRQDRKQEVKM